jgi:putative flippase GtrA
MSPAVKTAKRIGRGTMKRGNWIQLVQFGVVGVSGYFVNLAVFAAITKGLHVHHIAAAIAAFGVAVMSNFWWNRHWTFDAKHGHAGFQAARFFTVSVLALVINLVVLEVLIRAGMPDLASQAIAVAVAMPFNFIGNKLWTFDEPRPEEMAPQGGRSLDGPPLEGSPAKSPAEAPPAEAPRAEESQA